MNARDEQVQCFQMKYLMKMCVVSRSKSDMRKKISDAVYRKTVSSIELFESYGSRWRVYIFGFMDIRIFCSDG